MEIANRAISFWFYQTSQESYFQEILYKNLDQKYAHMQKQQASQSLLHDQEMLSMKERIQQLGKDHEQDKRKLQDLTDQYMDKSRQLQKLQNLYEKVKRKSFFGNNNGNGDNQSNSGRTPHLQMNQFEQPSASVISGGDSGQQHRISPHRYQPQQFIASPRSKNDQQQFRGKQAADLKYHHNIPGIANGNRSTTSSNNGSSAAFVSPANFMRHTIGTANAGAYNRNSPVQSFFGAKLQSSRPFTPLS